MHRNEKSIFLKKFREVFEVHNGEVTKATISHRRMEINKDKGSVCMRYSDAGENS